MYWNIFWTQSGFYFANNFIMGGERFDQTVPEAYLFGENTDLNFLGSKPIAVSVSDVRFHEIPVKPLFKTRI